MDGHSPIPDLILRQYQLDGIEAVREQIRAGLRRIVFVLATGGGKTATAGSIVRGAVALGKRVLFVAHRRELINQTHATLQRLGLPPDQLGVIMAGDRRHRPTAPVQIASIDTLRGRLHWPEADLVIVDEAHRSLSKSYLDLIARYSVAGAVILGLTATPYRGDNRGLGEAYESLVVIATPRLLIDEGYLVEPIVFTVERLPDISSVKTTAGDYNEAQLAEAVDRTELVGNIVEHWITHARGMRTVVFAVNVAHSRHITDRFVAAGIAAEHLDGSMRTADRDAILARLERGETRVVSNCGVLMEGWDCLDSETEILTANGWRGIGRVSVGDIVLSLNRSLGTVEPVVAEAVGERDVRPHERMVSIRSQHANIRTTEGHEFHIKYQDPKTASLSSTWLTRTGAQLAERRSPYALPLCGEMEYPGVPLTDDELRFVAWFMTDGGFERNATDVTINQSKHWHTEIRALLDRLDLDVRERVRPNDDGTYPSTLPRHEFRIPKGTRSGSLARRGWFARFGVYLDKNVAPALHAMTRQQFSVFWAELLKGDGEQLDKSGWLWCDRIEQVDAYTRMAVTRGFAVSYSPRVTAAGRTVYRVSVRDRRWLVSDAGDRRAARITLEVPRDGERVWCVTNQNGTLITRRGGKVVVLGNCPAVKCAVLARPTKSTGLYLQQAGRILRPYQDLPAIILDHAGNAIEHGLPQDDREFALHMPKRRAKAASVRTCQQCFAVLPAATRQCPHCGYEFAAAPADPVELNERDGKLVEITAPKNADEVERHAMRRKIQSLAVHHDRSHGLAIGETNRRLRLKFGKSRSDMTLLELYAVWQYFESGAYAIDHAPRVDAPPPFLSAAQEVVTWPL